MHEFSWLVSCCYLQISWLVCLHKNYECPLVSKNAVHEQPRAASNPIHIVKGTVALDRSLLKTIAQPSTTCAA